MIMPFEADARQSKSRLWCWLIILAVMACSPDPPESYRTGRMTVNEFLDFRSRLKAGLNYTDYARRVGDLRVAYERFERERGAYGPPLESELKWALFKYEGALAAWGYYLKDTNTLNGLWPTKSSRVNTVEAMLGKRFPRIQCSEGECVWLSDVLDDYWAEAYKEVIKADNWLRKCEVNLARCARERREDVAKARKAGEEEVERECGADPKCRLERVKRVQTEILIKLSELKSEAKRSQEEQDQRNKANEVPADWWKPK